MGVGPNEMALLIATVQACEGWMVADPSPGAVPDRTRPREMKAPRRATASEKMGRCQKLIRARELWAQGWPLDLAVIAPMPPWPLCGGEYRRAYKHWMKTLEDAACLEDGERLRYVAQALPVTMEDLWLIDVLPVGNAKDAAALRTYVGAHGRARLDLIERANRRFG